jgi:hypothetical protein
MSPASLRTNGFFAIGHKPDASDAEFSTSVGTAHTSRRGV